MKRDQIAQVIKLYENDPYMTVAWISRESGFSTHLFQWTNLIIEYQDVAKKLGSLGLQVIEEKQRKVLE